MKFSLNTSPIAAPIKVLCIACGPSNDALLPQWLGDTNRYHLLFWESPDSFELDATCPPEVILLGSTAGVDSLSALAAQWPSAKVVVLIEPEQEADIDAWLSRGADDYLVNSQFSEVRLAYTMQRLVAQAQTLERRVAVCTAELRQAKDAVEAAHRTKSLLIADLGHDLRTPINSILGFCQLLSRESNLSTEHREGLDIMHSSGEHLLALVNGLLGVAQKPAATPSPRAARRVLTLAPGQPPCRLLIVEDDWTSRALMQALLAPLGFELQIAIQGQEAINRWADWQPHLIWMATQIADMDGYEVTRRIRSIEHRQLQPETPADLFVPTKIIALTVNGKDERLKALASGCNDSVAKPLNPEVILKKIAEHLAIEYDYTATSPGPAPQGFAHRLV